MELNLKLNEKEIEEFGMTIENHSICYYLDNDTKKDETCGLSVNRKFYDNFSKLLGMKPNYNAKVVLFMQNNMNAKLMINNVMYPIKNGNVFYNLVDDYNKLNKVKFLWNV